MTQPCESRNTYFISSWLFVRLLGLTYLLAFLSAFIEVRGLIGSDGIIPVHNTLASYLGNNSLDFGRLLAVVLSHPTVFWVESSDFLLFSVTASGIVLSLLVFSGICCGPALLLLWFLYLSIVNVGSVFFAFQWDTLLLEATLPALFLPIWKPLDLGWKPTSCAVNRFTVWLYRWLVFRVMFFSGVVKLAKGCIYWSSMTALAYYYETQLLPSPVALYAHQLPMPVQIASTVAAVVIELCGPFLIFLGRRARLVAAVGFFLLMALIGLTGNHGYFNALSCVICLFLIDDHCYLQILEKLKIPVKRLLPEQARAESPAASGNRTSRRALIAGLAVVLITLLPEALRFKEYLQLPPALASAGRLLSLWGIAGNYGLYETIFPNRSELEFEGSYDRLDWQPYHFKYKVQELDKTPPFLLLLQPRLDWRLRFAAIGEPEQSPWLKGFLSRLLSGSPAVAGLLSENPFKAAPPTYVRVMRYTYNFETPSQLGISGHWWRRDDAQEFIEPTDLD
jgi:uncharacterized membrane protein YphA (DoxX/SURF4 family)